MHLRRSICVLLLLGDAATARGQEYGTSARVQVPSESVQVRNRLRAIDRLIEPPITARFAGACLGRLGVPVSPLEAPLAVAPLFAERSPAVWQQVLDGYTDLMGDAGELLVPLSMPTDALTSAHTSVQVRRLCHLRLAALPRSLRAAYRRHVDGEARQLLARGRLALDSGLVRQVVDEVFCSSSTPAALDLLGDLAFERGDFDEARAWWRRLAPLPSANGTTAESFPSRWLGATMVDRVRVQAKQILALGFEGALTQAQEELARFHRRYPNARGTIAGKEGLYSETVHAALQQVIRASIANNSDPWTTYGGTPGRNAALTVCPTALLWEDGPSWRVRLPALGPPRKGRDKNGAPERSLSTKATPFHPLIVGKQVLIADADSVTSYALATGKQLFRYQLRSDGRHDRAGPVPRFTLTAADGQVYARLGRQALAPRRGAGEDAGSYLVCLDLTAPADNARPREKWRVQSKAGEYFEGAPLVHAGRAYVALSRLVGKRVVTALQCYDALGRLRWSSDVCDIPEFEDSPAPRARQHLLTWAGNQIVYCTHTGAVAAVDPWTGQLLWVVRYASRGPLRSDGTASPRGLAPCVHDNGRLYVAPLDSERLYCLEAFTGRLLWERDDLEVVHLLGAANGRLVVTTRRGVLAINSADGLTLWQQPGEGRLASLGRGLVAGSWLLWPTHDPKLPLRALTLAEGRQQKGDEENPFAEPRFFDPTQFRAIPPGNLAFGHGCLVVAGTEELVAFVPRARQRLVPAEPEPPLHIQVRLDAGPHTGRLCAASCVP